ncbi:DUF4440 domain-containing protein [Paracnuella aquatica]|uniref:DUF4440 domain-containing protein n=1 Tax=Paracnuella aquatica TaxID=2268757 RepID=UPI000F517523|nr:DUF4440 domain-containing protein [Paracnuella aquatica]RPD46535.1 DUF4440 domain-containing protein [Paracnuella aquatica]
MKKICLLILLMIFSGVIVAQKDQQAIQATIVGFFNGLSLLNADTLRYYTTADFELLEDGEQWTMDTLLNKMAPMKGSNVIRINSFNFLTTRIHGNTAWVSYDNTADYQLGEKRQQVRWLESAVLVKNKDRWIIQLLHSTKKN